MYTARTFTHSTSQITDKWKHTREGKNDRPPRPNPQHVLVPRTRTARAAMRCDSCCKTPRQAILSFFSCTQHGHLHKIHHKQQTNASPQERGETTDLHDLQNPIGTRSDDVCFDVTIVLSFFSVAFSIPSGLCMIVRPSCIIHWA
jgi:hypothetical protein